MLVRSQELNCFIGISKILRVHAVDDFENCSCFDPMCTAPGKHPAEKRGVWDSTTLRSAGQLEAYKQWNIGLQCGEPTQSSFGFIVIDVDPRNGGHKLLAQWEAEHGKLPPTWTTATGGGGWHYFYRCYERLASRKFSSEGIEVQGYGSYVLLPTSTHVSGRMYEWDDTGHPNDVALCDAPDWLVEMCRKKKVEEIPEGEKEKLPLEEFKNVLDSLHEISPDSVYHEWLSIGMGMHATGWGREAFNAWHEWSRQGTKYQDGECAKKWKTFKHVTDNSVTHETIHYLANQAVEPFEWAPEPEEEAPTVITATKEEEETPAKKVPMPPGFLGDLTRFIADNSYRRHDSFAVEAACMIIASLAQRTFLVDGAQMNLYSILVAPPASGKNDYLELTREIVNLSRAHTCLTQPASEKGLRVLMKEEPSRLWIHDEQLSWLLEAASPRSISKHLLADVLSLWGRVRTLSGSRARKKEDSIDDVAEPKLSWFGTGTKAQLSELVKTEANATGLLSRLNLIMSDQPFSGTRRKAPAAPVDSSLIRELKTLWPTPFFDAGEIQLRNLSLDRDAKWLVNDIERSVDSLCDTMVDTNLPDSVNPIAMMQRNTERIVRYAGVVCLSRRGDVVTGDDITWAREWLDYTADPIRKLMKADAFGTKWDDRIARIESQIQEGGSVSWGELLRRNRRFKRSELEEILTTLIESDDVSRSTRGRGTFYKWKSAK